MLVAGGGGGARREGMMFAAKLISTSITLSIVVGIGWCAALTDVGIVVDVVTAQPPATGVGETGTMATAEPEAAPPQEQQQQQTFRITPKDVEAVQGDEVVMRCEIEHLAGWVQWTKDGFALGFGNEIAGFPRFSLNQNHSDGVYNLRITNTSYDDAAQYQCQVGPAHHNRPIRAQAKLTVLAPPKGYHDPKQLN
ncbi:irregular chiasm C-roughest protein-like [Anopheles darlingi]|uniref:irregular chiasm C-roughest protein-like n=1 Tax=Anopheles darlingi TaxID=43151 RepID=UPI00210066C1|nr:irregular chiasm C-roughest protein-like [Anopheles darlingi]